VHVKQCPLARARWNRLTARSDMNTFHFTDEAAFSERALLRRRAWSPRGVRSRAYIHSMRSRRYSALVTIGSRGLVAIKIVGGGINKAIYTSYVERDLVRLPLPASCAAHARRFLACSRTTAMRPITPLYMTARALTVFSPAPVRFSHLHKLLCLNIRTDCAQRFLPAYSPDLNPIEKLFGIIKSHLRRSGGLRTP
jgi:hypothetical protein